MTSIITNTSAIAALSTLRSINTDMETTQSRISSGYEIETAKDNAAYWSIATTMRSDNKALSTVQDALGLGAATSDVAYTALESSIDVVDEIKAKITAASEPGVDKDKIQKEITQLQDQLRSVAKSASFSGENWVYHDEVNAAATESIVGSFNRDAQGNVSLTTLDFDTSKSSLIQVDSAGADVTTVGGGLLSSYIEYIDADGTTATTGFSVLSLDVNTDDLTEALSAIDTVLQDMTDAAADVGSINSRIDLQATFVADLMDSIETGVGKLVDADMNEESTRLKALQTQQQLGVQALSIANSASQNILTLFQQ
ncbi:flagellin [Neorhizobium sp. JUb45]|uniref:flagellin N-terminal helical domain-containing protein n=1 Tax=unclassified Neorhizobium TaxID=2629175 RepID=UPI001052ABA2|nr:flagellin [Neorhizobium sp. JUb45]TCR03981.1 flagellin [Neorhizobium sp. JUb45]